MAMSETLRAELSQLVVKNPVVLFMKGSRKNPQCGFSAQVVKILDELVPQYETVDVLASPELRDAIKEFSDWPTIPQLYVGGQFVGGCDIVRELGASGELQKVLGASVVVVAPPTITVTDAAAKAFAAAMVDVGGDPLHLQITADCRHDLFFGPREPNDLEVVANGLTLLVDRATVRLANGVVIDFVEGAQSGFKITNPNEPPQVRSLSPKELQVLLASGERLDLFDVRTPAELAIARLERAIPLDENGERYLNSLDPSAPIAFLCHHGARSRAAAQHAIEAGFLNVYNVEGGIDAWSLTVDDATPRY
jgi:monothiol glutaredoxin